MVKKNICKICKNKISSTFYSRNFDQRIGKYQMLMGKCDACDFYSQLKGIGSEKETFIYKNQFIGGVKKQKKYYENYSIFRKNVSEFIYKNEKLLGNRVCEVGSSSGFVLAQLKEKMQEKEYFGYDLDLAAIKYGNDFNESIKLSSSDFFATEKSFDFIYLSHLLEHLDNPIDFLKNVSSKLNKSGKIGIFVPASTFKFEYPMWEHKNFFSPNSFKAIFKIMNWHIEDFSVNEVYGNKNTADISLIVSPSKSYADKSCSIMLSDNQTMRMARVGIREWYDKSTSKNETNQFKELYKNYKSGRTLKELLLWSKLYRIFTLANIRNKKIK